MPEILSLRLLVAQAYIMRIKHNVTVGYAAGYVFLAAKVNRLGYFTYSSYGPTLAQFVANGLDGLLAHTVNYHVGTRVAKYAALEAVLPIIIMREPPHRGLYASEDYRNVGIEAAQYLAVDYRWIFRPAVVPAVGAVCVFRAQAPVGRVLVNHRVHASRGYAKEQARTPQLLEVAVVTVPVGLRNNRHAQPLSLERAADYGRAERRMVDIRVGREQDYVKFVPSPQLRLLLCGWQPCRLAQRAVTLGCC